MGVLKKLPPKNAAEEEVRGLGAPNLLPINGDPIHRVTVNPLVCPAEPGFQVFEKPGGEDYRYVLAPPVGAYKFPYFDLFHAIPSCDPRSPGPGEASVRV